MYWFQMILSRDGHIRVATLQNHMLQHNDFTKAFLPELHLPEWQRMSLVKRLLRLALYLLCVLHFGLVTSTSGYVGLVADVSMDVSLDVHHARRDCMRRCQEAGFPSVLCVDTPGLTVTRHHNSYSSIYEFSRPPDYQTDYVKAGFDACLEMALEPLGGIGGRWIEGENRAMRDAVCFSSCWRPEEPLVADEPDGRPPCLCTHRDVKMCSLPQETPGQACREDSGCWFNGTKCLSRAGYEATPCEEEPCSSWMDSAEPQRQELLTACQQKVGEFSAALSNPASATSSTTAVPLARQLAIVLGIPQATNTTTTTTTTLPPSPVLPLEAQIRTVDKLLCVSEKESPERLPYVANFAKIFGESSNVCLSGSVVLYAVLLVDVVQFILEYVICYIVDQSFSLEGFLPEEEREVLFETGWRRCLGQTILCTSTALMMMGCVKPLLVADLLGHTGTALTHVGAVLLADQAKALLIQPIIWAVLIIRLGFAMPGIQVYNDYYMEQWDEEESLVEACQLFVQMVFETRVVTWGIIAIVSFYAMFVLLSLLLDEYLSMISWWSDAYFNVDFSILCFFVLEIILKTFAYVTDYILDIWNVVDAIIVLLSFSLSVSGLNIGGLALLRLLRLLRVVMVIRKVSANQKRLKELNKKSATGYNVGSNADRVLEIIEDLRGHKVVPRYTKADLDWMVELISSNKLYAITVEDEDTDEGMSAWMNDAVKMSTKAKDTTDEGKEKAAGDLLSKVSGIKTSQTRASGVKADGSKASSRTVSTMGGRLSTNRSNSVSQRRRSSRRRADRDLDSYEKLQIQLRERAGISDTQDKQVSLVLEKVDLWTFDIFPLSDMLEVSDVFIPVFFGRVAIYDDLVEVLCLDLELMWNWLKKMTSADVTRPNIFHGGAHTGSMIQTLYFFMRKGMVQHMEPVHRLICYMAPIIMNHRHPGLSNSFMVSVRHPQALRYNDEAVIQNYALATAFTYLTDPEMNFFIHTDMPLQDTLRLLLIKAIMKQDLKYHFPEVGLLKTKMGSAFPEDTIEDKVVLISTAIRLAEISWICRPQSIYVRWSERVVEEFFGQGDVEKTMGLAVSPFCDRDVVSAPKMQLSFALVICYPLVSAWCALYPELEAPLVEQGLEQNRAYLEAQVRGTILK